MQIFVKKLSREQIEVTENLQDTNWYEKSGFKRAQRTNKNHYNYNLKQMTRAE